MTAGARDERYDAIVVGSGVGGLCVASLLSQLYGRRVLVLERHHTLGGYTHTFARPGGWEWDVGVHYVGGMQRSGVERDAMSVVVGGSVDWQPMADPFERLVFPGFEFAIRAGRENFAADLVAAFPTERVAISSYFRDVDRAVAYFGLLATNGLMPEPVRRVLMAFRRGAGRLARMTTAAYLTERFHDPHLRSILGARWPDYGLPPGSSAFLIHALITKHYFDGASYPMGSAASIAEGARTVIQAHGGELRTRVEVAEILVESGRAVGVRTHDNQEYRAPIVISDVGARSTYLRLLSASVPLPFREELRTSPSGFGAAVVFYGLSASPKSLGIQGENFWLHSGVDQDALFLERNSVCEGTTGSVFVSFPSLKDPFSLRHTAQAMAPLDAETLSRFRATSWRERGEEYEAVKRRIAGAIDRTIEARLPGFGALVASREVATPLSFEHFTAHTDGACYGVPFTPERIDQRWLRAKTPIPGLFLAGADVASPGVVGALMGGVIAVASIEGMGAFKKIRRAAATQKEDKPSAWVDVRVVLKKRIAPEILEIELESTEARSLPGWKAGSHIVVRFGQFLQRPYSLCGAPAEAPTRYRLGILLEPGGNASGLWNESIEAGTRLRIGVPQDSFQLDETREAFLLAGGIGVTPLLSMAYRAKQLGLRVAMRYSARNLARAAFADELRGLLGDGLALHAHQPGGDTMELDAALAAVAPDADIYVCGPPAFLQLAQETVAHLGTELSRLHYESFGPGLRLDDEPFRVRLSRSNVAFDVPATRTIGAVLHDHGIELPHVCGTGMCGACVVKALSGDIDHRDSVLSIEQRARGDMAVCVSRARGEVVLDL